MKACLTKTEFKIWFWRNGLRIEGRHERLRGDVSRLVGDVSDLRGDASRLVGDVSGLRGDASGLVGNLDECKLSAEEREAGVKITALIKP